MHAAQAAHDRRAEEEAYGQEEWLPCSPQRADISPCLLESGEGTVSENDMSHRAGCVPRRPAGCGGWRWGRGGGRAGEALPTRLRRTNPPSVARGRLPPLAASSPYF